MQGALEEGEVSVLLSGSENRKGPGVLRSSGRSLTWDLTVVL